MWNKDTIQWIDIELTSFCNLKCPECLREKNNTSSHYLNKKYLDLETLQKRIQPDTFPSLHNINFCGTIDEPTSHPQFFEIMDYFSWVPYLSISTNGSTRTTNWWERAAKVLSKTSHKVTWGIDGSDETSQVYRIGSSFKKVEKNYRAFINAGGKAEWQFIVFEHNEHQLEEARQKAKDEGFVRFKVIYSHRPNDSGKVKKKEVEQLHKESKCIECRYLKDNRIFINHMGHVIPCCHLNGKLMDFTVQPKLKSNFEEYLETVDYESDINLNNVSIDQAINGKVWSHIANSWDTENPIQRCVQVCKTNNRDKFVKENLK